MKSLRNQLSTYHNNVRLFLQRNENRFCNYPPNLHFACSGRRGHRAWAKIDGEKCSPETKAQKLIFYIDFPNAMQRKIGENILYSVLPFISWRTIEEIIIEGVSKKDKEYYVFTKFNYYYFVLLSCVQSKAWSTVRKSCLTNFWPCPLSIAQWSNLLIDPNF